MGKYPLLKLRTSIGVRFGHIGSMLTLGAILESEGGPEQIAAANRLYRDAAARGNAQAMYNLGVNHLVSKGGAKPDHDQAIRWLTAATDAGHGMSAWALGKMCLLGRIVDLDQKRGLELLELAAQRGCRPAQENLVQIFREGKYDVEPDPSRAARWESELATAAVPASHG